MEKRINPNTGELFKSGDIRHDGYVFKSYEPSISKSTNGFIFESWMSPDSAFRYRVRKALKRTKSDRKRADHLEALANNLDIDYLMEIFPENKRCPVFGMVMEWGGESSYEQNNSPSLDRINPDIGYIRGNVQWISFKANRVKSDQNIEGLVKLGGWAERVLKYGLDSARNYTHT